MSTIEDVRRLREEVMGRLTQGVREAFMELDLEGIIRSEVRTVLHELVKAIEEHSNE